MSTQEGGIRGGPQGVAEEILVVMAEEVEEEMKVIVGRAMEMAEVVEDFSITREIMIVTVKQITRTNWLLEDILMSSVKICHSMKETEYSKQESVWKQPVPWQHYYETKQRSRWMTFSLLHWL